MGIAHVVCEVNEKFTIDKTPYCIKIIKDKVTSLTKTSIIGEFLNNHKKDYKIIIVDDIATRVMEAAINQTTEIFREKEL